MLQMFSATAFLLSHSKALRTGLLKRAIKPHNFSQFFFKTGAKNNQLLTATLISFLGVSSLLGMRGKKLRLVCSWLIPMIIFQVSDPVNSGGDEKPPPIFQCQEGEKVVNYIKL